MTTIRTVLIIESASPTPPPPPQPQRDYKTAMIRINRAGWQELSFLSTELDRPLDELLIEAANALLVAYGKPAIIEKRLP